MDTTVLPFRSARCTWPLLTTSSLPTAGRVKSGAGCCSCIAVSLTKSLLEVIYEGIFDFPDDLRRQKQVYLFVFRFHPWIHVVFENYSLECRLRGRPQGSPLRSTPPPPLRDRRTAGDHEGPHSTPHCPRSYETVLSQE